MSFQNSAIVLQRGETVSTLTPDDLSDSVKNIFIVVTWSLSELLIICGTGDDALKSATVPTVPTMPPASLITWARKQNLLPVTEFDSEEDFRNKVYSCLASIQDKVNEIGIRVFWDFEYDENKIISRKPKKEIDIHEHIHSILSDQMLMASIEVVPEYQTGIGNLDFMFLGPVKGRGICRFCAEFKHAHSPGIFKGIEVQLPLYMQNKNAEYGAYCVLYFKGDWFDEPKNKTMSDLELDIQCRQMEKAMHTAFSPHPNTCDFSKPTTASKR